MLIFRVFARAKHFFQNTSLLVGSKFRIILTNRSTNHEHPEAPFLLNNLKSANYIATS